MIGTFANESPSTSTANSDFTPDLASYSLVCSPTSTRISEIVRKDYEIKASIDRNAPQGYQSWNAYISFIEIEAFILRVNGEFELELKLWETCLSVVENSQ